jgi:DNA-binding response OmpR family regulator
VSHRPARVLVVEDVDDIRDLIAINLRLEGFDVATAEDGLDCLAVVGDYDPDVITLDVAMPRLDGFSTAEQLRGSPATAHIPLIIVSARAQGSDKALGEEIGVNAYLTKPFDPEELVATVRRLVEQAADDGPADTMGQ